MATRAAVLFTSVLESSGLRRMVRKPAKGMVYLRCLTAGQSCLYVSRFNTLPPAARALTQAHNPSPCRPYRTRTRRKDIGYLLYSKDGREIYANFGLLPLEGLKRKLNHTGMEEDESGRCEQRRSQLIFHCHVPNGCRRTESVAWAKEC